jgi:histidine phosphotransferase ChpT
VALDIRVLELLASRMCHDLVSPVGAIHNGVELIAEMEEEGQGGPAPEFMGEAIKLIAHSSRQADQRLRAFRLAYGAGGRDARDFAEIRRIAEGWVDQGRTRLNWPAGTPSDTLAARPGVAKVLLAVVILAEDALTHGGVVTVDGAGAADAATGSLTVTASGRPGLLSEAAAAALAGSQAEEVLGPRTIHAFVTGQMASQYGLTLAAAPAGPDTLLFRLSW